MQVSNKLLIGVFASFYVAVSSTPVNSADCSGNFLQALQRGDTYRTLNPVILDTSIPWVSKQSAQPLCKQGFDALTRKQWEKAIQLYSRVIEKEPSNGVALTYRAIARYFKFFDSPEDSSIRRNSDELKTQIHQDLSAAISEHPDCGRLYRNRALAVLSFGVLDAKAPIADYNKAMTFSPHDPACSAAWGRLLINLHDLPRAIKVLTLGIKGQKTSSLYYLRGQAYWRDGEYSKALADETAAIQLDPNNYIAYYESGLCNLSLHNDFEAKSDFTRAIALCPTYAQSFQMRAVAYMTVKNFAGGLSDIEATIRLTKAPTAEMYLSKASCLIGLRRYESALAEADSVLKGQPRDIPARVLRAQAMKALGRNKEAIAELENALRLDPRNLPALTLKAEIDGRSGHLEQSLADLVDAKRFERDYKSKPSIYTRSGDFGRELETASQARVNKEMTTIYKRGSQQSAKAISEAISGYTKVINLNKASGEPFFNRGFLYLCLNDYTAASADFETALKLGAKDRTESLTLLYLYICKRKMNSASASSVLARVGKQDRFLSRLVACMANPSTDCQTLITATTNSQKVQAHLFLGMEAAIDGKPQQARNNLEWVRDHADIESDEYTLGMCELSRVRF